ncbi:MAG: tRNA pseudouridine(55) synthase TruB [Bacteroidia bacterium]
MNQSPEPARVLLIDKPEGWTSFQAVKRLKYALKARKIGHAGTLDPLATGLLIICQGKKTKEIELIQAMPKEYTGMFVLGETTPSFDLETAVDKSFPTNHITDELLAETVTSFLGEQEQTPPLFSAVKVNGKRAYDIARSGGTAELKSKKINISEFEINRIEKNKILFRVVCSKGTYIRSLARDFGNRLNSGAYLTNLRRTKIGDYSVEQAHHPKTDIESIIGQ